MEQKIPNISDHDIKRIIKRDFPQFEFSEIESILKMYKSESEKGRNRIYASILKLSNCNIDLMKKYVENANKDYRDIIALSEYPNYSEYAFDDNLTEEKEKQLITDDWIQYITWLNKT
ncbi:MAG TPA: hypothetical protein VGQ09_11050 [Chitinophagaceae bacterium]|jgi:hypothetical protein|nr:hypothetical protein [Chitinophagaceae bacterium]